MFVWTQQLSAQLILASSAWRAQMPTLSTGNGRAVTLTGLCNCSSHSTRVSSPNPNAAGTGCITLPSTGSLFSWKKGIFFFLYCKIVWSRWMLSVYDLPYIPAEGKQETWWGYQMLSMVTMELKTNQLRRGTQVCVSSGRNSGQQTQLSSPFL